MRLHLVVLLMAATNIIGCSGIRTESSAITPPPGAMRVCDEGVISAPGVVSARPNFVTHTVKDPDDFRPRAVTIVEGFPLFVAYNTDTDAWRVEDTSDAYSGEAQPPSDLSRNQFAQMRRNVYLTTSGGIGRVDATAGAVLAAGLPAPGTGSLALGGPGTWLANNESVAYRWTLTRTDDRGLVVTSAPAPYQSITNGSGVADGVIVTIPLPFEAAVGDVLRVFRSLVISSAATPADTMFLTAQVTLDAGDTFAGIVTITDETDQVDLGEALYTNSTREGIEGANQRPPSGIALATWNDSMWVGSTTGYQTLVLDVFDSAGFPAAEEVALGVLPPVSYSTANGSPILAYSSGDDTDVAVGFSVVGANIPAGARIITVNPGASIELDVNATATAGASVMTIRAVHTIDGEEFVAVLGGAETAASINENSDFLRARYIENAGALTGRPGYFRILIERLTFGGSAFTFTTNAAGSGTSYVAADGGALASTLEDRPNRVAFSKPMQPEHFRALDYFEIGNEDAHVLAFAPLGDALLVFKQDGVWSVFGTYPNFGVERVGDAAIISGDAVDVLDDVAYAYTNRGILAMNGGGILANLSEGVISGDLAAYSANGPNYVRAWPALGVVLIAVGNDDDLTSPAAVYVWNVLTRAWCRWTVPAVHMAYDVLDGTMWAPWGVDRWEVRESVAARGYDESFSLDSLTTQGTAVTIAESSLDFWVPSAGDVLSATVAESPSGVGAPVGLVLNINPGDTSIRPLSVASFTPPQWVRCTSGVDTEDVFCTSKNATLLFLADPVAGAYAAGPATVTPLTTVVSTTTRRVTSATDGGLSWSLEIDEAFPTGYIISASGTEVAQGVLEWQRNGGTAPSTAGFIREVQVHLDQVDAANDALSMERLRLTVGTTSDQGTTRYDLVATPVREATYSRPVRVGVSRQTGRSTHLYPYVEVNELYAWRVLGIALVGSGTSDKVRLA